MVILFITLFHFACCSTVHSDQFLWGAATAAYQIEGAYKQDGRGTSIWDTFSHNNKTFNGDNGDVADDSYNKLETDIALLKQLGVNSYRFSISWSRMFPSGTGEVNLLAVEHYNKLINLLLDYQIQPLVTLFHWDTPQDLEEEYNAWLDRRIITDFVHYADACFAFFGDRVTLWTTLNEPWTFCLHGYITGIFAPGRCSDRSRCAVGDSNTEGYVVAHHMLLAHAAAVRLYREKYQSTQRGRIGIVLNHDWAEPLTSSSDDVLAAQRRNEFAMGWFADPLYFGNYPQIMRERIGDRLPTFTIEESISIRGSLDFLGLNHYSSKYYSAGGRDTSYDNIWAADQATVESKYDTNGVIIGAQGASPWLNAVPWGFGKVILWATERYQRPLIYITENGCDILHENDIPRHEAVRDVYRVNYLKSYLSAMHDAIGQGADVRGYFVWSLLDNFEWADGYRYRFGLYYVDYKIANRTRYPKMSAYWYSNYVTEQRNSWKIWMQNCASGILGYLHYTYNRIGGAPLYGSFGTIL